MTTPRIPPLKIIEDRPSAMAPPPRPSQPPRQRWLGYLLTGLAFALLSFGLVSAQHIYPAFHLPLWSELTLFASFPVVIYGVVKLG
ncbi:hypothetical protein [Chitinibacter tainanensis]|uniref:hypothetical protein n=1 Tax=Chitinibacter tainanensis TaxID=230667 RepID=UPI002354AE8E|nr:hypothetical protein [Chitinibacter tainanensis]